MLSNLHPLVKTSQDVRRAIARMEAYMQTNPEDAAEHNAEEVLKGLHIVKFRIPAKFVDADLKEVTT